MENNKIRFAIGTGGWEHEVFDSCFYSAPSLDSLGKLSAYAASFDFVEVRPTFWDDTITARDATEWIAAVRSNRRFQFGIKLHRSFTHKRELTPGSTRAMRGVLCEVARNGRLGGVVAQFPYSFTNTSANRFYLVKLGEIFSGFPLFVELRHASWDFDGLREFLHEQMLQIVNADFPRLKQYPSFRSEVIGDGAYLRLHGRNEKGWLVNAVDARYDYLYNGKELQELKRRVDRLAARAKTVTVVFNNTTGGKAIANAFQLQSLLGTEKARHIPSSTLKAFAFLAPLVAKETGQTELPGGDLYREAM